MTIRPVGEDGPEPGHQLGNTGDVSTADRGEAEGAGPRERTAPGTAGPAGGRLLELGKRAWAVVGFVLVLWGVLLLVDEVRLVVVALVLALFPAALLAPVARWLRDRRVPGTVVALLLLLALLAVIGLAVQLVVPPVVGQAPAFADAADRAFDRLQALLDATPVSVEIEDLGDAASRAIEALGGGQDVAGRGLSAATTAVHALTGLLLSIVALFFYLKDGPRLWAAVRELAPRRRRGDVQHVAERIWWTLGAYLRGQLVVALVDAVLIGLGLVVLDVPLALPLAVVIFVGGLFPIVGAFASGLLAVLVALADQGLVTAGLVLAVVVAVQQAEGNLLEPLILSKVIALHPLVIIVSITAGALLLGVLGAFLAVPVVASVARTVDYLRGRQPDAGPGAD